MSEGIRTAMKNLKFRFSLPVLLGFLGVGVVIAGLAEVRMGQYTANNRGKITQSASPNLTVDSQYEVAAYPAFDVALADGPGRGEVQIYCNTCHTTRYIPMQPPLPAATWEAEVQKMVKSFGAPIPEADARKIVSYLQQHYTPETRK
jgi:hypothetical protein